MRLMDPLDAIMLVAESLGNPMHVGSAIVLTPPPDAAPDYLDRIHADTVSDHFAVDARFRRRPHRGLETGGMWVWRDVDPVLPDHVERVSLHGGTLEEVWELIGVLHAEPLPQDRPMWHAWLIEGLEDGRFVLYTKVHHSVVDGVGGLRLIGERTSVDPDERDMPPFHACRRRDEMPAAAAGDGTPETDGNPLVRAVRWGAAATTAATSTLASAGGTAYGAATGAAGLAVRMVEGQVETLARGLTADDAPLPFTAPRTRLNGALDSSRVFAAGSWPRARLRAVQQAAGVTSNDVVTAMVSGALRSWLLEHDELPRDTLVAICPVSVRSRDEDDGASAGGNAFGTAVAALGTDREDPLDRLDVIHRSMDRAKSQVYRLGSLPSLTVAAPSILPTILLPMLPFDPHVPPGFNVPISNVPGPQETRYWNGARVEAIYPASVVYDGIALNVTVCTYDDQVCFGLVAGGKAFPDIDELVPLLEDALVELETALGVSA